MALALHSSLPGQAKDYWAYHEHINQAEKLISQENFQEALHVYDTVFHQYDFVFLRDYKIAAQLATYLNQQEKAFQIIEMGISAGWPIKSIKKHRYLTKLQKLPKWTVIEAAHPELRKKYLTRIDEHTRNTVHQMFKMDQRKALGVFLRIGDKAKERQALKKFAPQSELHLKKFMDLLAHQGYPGEKLIGNNFWMSTILSHHNSISETYAKQDTLYQLIKPQLVNAIALGQMSPYEFALIDDWQIAVSTNRSQTGYGYINPPLQASLVETNTLRSRIGLRSVALRNQLIDIADQTGMDFHLPNWLAGKILVE